MTGEQLLTVQDVARLLQVKPRWVYDRYAQGLLPGAKVGRYLRFRTEDIEQFVRRSFGDRL